MLNWQTGKSEPNRSELAGLFQKVPDVTHYRYPFRNDCLSRGRLRLRAVIALRVTLLLPSETKPCHSWDLSRTRT
jgi:hypothetical protein